MIALTSRDSSIIAPTLKQLADVGVDFAEHWDEENHVLDLDGSDGPVEFDHGIIFCGNNPKGKSLMTFFKHFDLVPKEVIMADDKKNNLESVSKEVERYGGVFHGIRYGYLDDKVKQINMHEATKQLARIQHLLAPEAMTAVRKLRLKLPMPLSSPNSPLQRYSFLRTSSQEIKVLSKSDLQHQRSVGVH